MSIIDSDQDVQLDIKNLDNHIEAAAVIVEELRDFLRDHHAELIKHHITVGGAGLTSEAPLAQQDPVFVGRLHNLGQACDQFINTMRNNF